MNIKKDELKNLRSAVEDLEAMPTCLHLLTERTVVLLINDFIVVLYIHY